MMSYSSSMMNETCGNRAQIVMKDFLETSYGNLEAKEAFLTFYRRSKLFN